MVVTRNNCLVGNLIIGDYKFERVDSFKYLRMRKHKKGDKHM